MITFNNTDDCNFVLPEKRKIAAWIKQCIAREGLKTGDIAVVFCDSKYHRNTNIRYLGHDYDTDVITFDYSENGVVSGDVLIGVGTVIDNARQLNITPLTEIHRIIIHGILHLCGYTDKKPSDKTTMTSKENDCLSLWF